MKTVAYFINKAMIAVIIITSIIAFYFPNYFLQTKHLVPALLGFIMLTMGLTITFDDFKNIIKSPKGILIGVLLQFILMPITAVAVVEVLKLPNDLAVGILLLSSAPGGTASNVITYLAKGNVALSVSCTIVSTLLSPIITPTIFYFLAREMVEIDVYGMFVSILQIVIFPVIAGLFIRHFFDKFVQKIQDYLPSISVLSIAFVIGVVIASSKTSLINSGMILFVAVFLHNTIAFYLGYFVSRFCRLNDRDARTIAIEVAMQNSGLSASLALSYLAHLPAASAPSALFSLWQNISGSIVASCWRKI